MEASNQTQGWDDKLSQFEEELEQDVNYTAEQRVQLSDVTDDYQTVSLRTIYQRQRPNISDKDFATVARTQQIYQQKNVEQISKAQRNEAFCVMFGSEPYKKFIAGLGQGDQKTAVCLTCWRYIHLYHKKHHEGFGHQCVNYHKIVDENSFLHYVRLFDRHAPNENTIELFKPMKKELNAHGMDVFHLPGTQVQNCKTRCENAGRVKGQPPFLGKPVVPFQMLPKHVHASAIISRQTPETKAMVEWMEQTPILQQAIQAEESGISDHRQDTFLSSLGLLTGMLSSLQLTVTDIERNIGSVNRKLQSLHAEAPKKFECPE